MSFPTSTDSKPILVIVTADNCGHCTNFKRTELEPLKQVLQASNKVQLEEINLPSTQSLPGAQYHPELKNYIGWFPTFILFTNSSWNNKNSPLKGVCLNGELKNGKIDIVAPSNRRRITKDSISQWINEELSNNPIFSESKSPAKPSIMLVNSTGSVQTTPTKYVPTIGKQIKIRARQF